jgi:hypothetical protein
LELTSEQVLALPIDELGLAILRDFDIAGGWNFRNCMLDAKHGYDSSAWGALAEAWEWLISRGLVCRDYSQNAAEAVRVSRLGRKTLDDG